MESDVQLSLILAYIIDKYCDGQAKIGSDLERFIRENPSLERIDGKEEGTFSFIVNRKPSMGSPLFGKN